MIEAHERSRQSRRAGECIRFIGAFAFPHRPGHARESVAEAGALQTLRAVHISAFPRLGSRALIFILLGLLLSRGSVSSAEIQAPSEAAGTIDGVVKFVGKVPMSTDYSSHGVEEPLVEVDPKTRGARHVAVMLKRRDGSAPTWTPGAFPLTTNAVVMDQRNHQFVPQVLAVRAGEPVVFLNSDLANHNIHTGSAKNPANQVNVYTPFQDRYEHRFVVEPQLAPVQVDCDMHPWMGAWVYVFDHPFFALTDAQGRFRINSVPPGEYTLLMHHAATRLRARQEVTVSSGTTASATIEIRPEEPSKLVGTNAPTTKP